MNWLLNYQPINWLFLAVVVGGHLYSSVTQPLTQPPSNLKIEAAVVLAVVVVSAVVLAVVCSYLPPHN